MLDTLKRYVDLFNENDEECYGNAIDNAHAYEWPEGGDTAFLMPR